MEKEGNMKTHRPLFTPIVLAFIVGILGGLIWGDTSAIAAAPTTTLVIPIAGTVAGGPESVALSGQTLIRSTFVADPTFGAPPGVVLSVNLVGVTGVGISTGARYLATGENSLTRLFRPADKIEVTFPFFPVGPKGTASARSALATFNLTFDTISGALTGATGSVTTPNFPQ
jgi:hypothetical protein